MSMADEIEKLNQLRLSGAITEEEYQTSKSALLNGQQVADKKPNQVVVSTQMDEKTWAILLHLSQFCGFLIPLAGLVGRSRKTNRSSSISTAVLSPTGWLPHSLQALFSLC